MTKKRVRACIFNLFLIWLPILTRQVRLARRELNLNTERLCLNRQHAS
ncbi:hypothetical protein HanIR_Chr01g0036571 [Helianthus annuus]|nr:hypothetical protein HanIR_Chr01g0036571 [Helianthus annuus]